MIKSNMTGDESCSPHQCELLSKVPGLMVIISSPSGVGKTTVAHELLKVQSNLIRSVSVTTRKPRVGEVDGSDYHFISDQKFDELASSNNMLEHAVVFGFKYGTLKAETENFLNNGTDVLFSIDWQGAFELKKNKNNNIVSIFLLPPSMQELKDRINNRGKDCKDTISKRLKLAAFEMDKCFEYDYIIVNREVEDTVKRVRDIISSEKSKTERQTSLVDFLKKMRSNCDVK